MVQTASVEYRVFSKIITRTKNAIKEIISNGFSIWAKRCCGRCEKPAKSKKFKKVVEKLNLIKISDHNMLTCSKNLYQSF